MIAIVYIFSDKVSFSVSKGSKSEKKSYENYYGEISVVTAQRYHAMYEIYVKENNLEDDSNTITIEALEDFIAGLDQEEKSRLFLKLIHSRIEEERNVDYLASDIESWLAQYRQDLRENGLADDSESISVSDLVNFVKGKE